MKAWSQKYQQGQKTHQGAEVLNGRTHFSVEVHSDLQLAGRTEGNACSSANAWDYSPSGHKCEKGGFSDSCQLYGGYNMREEETGIKRDFKM